ncbi:hypothetical protein [Flavobacterium filum]|uniref:hypothetical protein n=1 Tax=Flavobacterium TaxID=237 RepID=UPI000418CCDF|nr:hypothetical protein [Flavobacterium filum]
MNVTININKTVSEVNIIKCEAKELEQINTILDGVMINLKEDAEIKEKIKSFGEDKLRNIALELFKEKMKEQEQEQIKSAIEFSEQITQAMINGVVKGAMQIAKEL